MLATEELLTHTNLDKPGELQMDTPVKVKVSAEHQLWVNIINLVILSEQHNKDNCCIRANTDWNFDLLRNLLENYHDHEIVDLLQYGWPVDRDMSIPLEMG